MNKVHCIYYSILTVNLSQCHMFVNLAPRWGITLGLHSSPPTEPI
jgi:hypothetical protein